jgi:diguanylate cyclase (GGDEF)-like protein
MTAGMGGRRGNVIYLGGDAGLAEELRTRLVQRVGFSVCNAVATLVEAIKATPGSVLLFDARGGAPAHDIATVLAQIGAAGVPRPIWVCLADPGDLSVRLHALRGGARACFAGGGSIDDLCTRLLALSGAGADVPYRVLVVDDQEVAALFATRVLEKAGMQVRAVSDALTVLDALEEMRPDLVLMDLHMPGADGIELTRIIREHEEFFGLPVVFLSGEGDPDRQMDALRVGGDDFLAKPVPVARLVETVRRRIEAARENLARGAEAAARDVATGLSSRGRLLQRIDQAIAGGAGKLPGTGVLYLEVDQARGMEDRPGLLDGVFAEVGRVLREGSHNSDLAARVGPGSLGLLVRRPDAEALLACAEGLRAMIAGQTWTLDGAALMLTASLGIGLFAPRAGDAITMISRAKKACSKARHAGGNRCEVYAPALPRQGGPAPSKRMADLIRAALLGDGLSLSYQPVVALRRHPGERYEALLRLHAADGELIPPFDFLPAAREFGLTPDIDRWVITRALDEALRWRADHQGLHVLIHQTLATATAPGWMDWLRDEIARRDLIRQRPALIFELDEIAARPDDAQACLAGLRRLGIDLCLDGVDDRPAVLQLLAAFPVSLVRLDQGVLAKMSNTGLAALVDAVHQSGGAVCATGIEHPQAIARVWGCGVDFIQGNFVQPAGEGLDFDFAGAQLV